MENEAFWDLQNLFSHKILQFSALSALSAPVVCCAVLQRAAYHVTGHAMTSQALEVGVDHLDDVVLLLGRPKGGVKEGDPGTSCDRRGN